MTMINEIRLLFCLAFRAELSYKLSLLVAFGPMPEGNRHQQASRTDGAVLEYRGRNSYSYSYEKSERSPHSILGLAQHEVLEDRAFLGS
eukprot:scaffold400648_cov46-Prasinocladus_malaysianus.AAC.1